MNRETHEEMVLPDHSALELSARLLACGTSPSVQMIRKEMQAKVREMLFQLSPSDREVLVLRYLEQLSTAETAAVLGLSADGVKSRQRRALERFSNLLADRFREDF